MTAETTAVRIAAGFAWRRALFAFVLTLLAAAALVTGFALGYQQAFDGRVVPGVSVAGVAVGGLDRLAAEARLRAELPDVSRGSLILAETGSSERISFAGLGRSYDFDAMLSQAVSVGRGGDLPARVLEDLQTLIRGANVQPVVTYDRAALAAAVSSLAARRDVAPQDASAALGRDGFFGVTPGRDGSAVDRQAAMVAADAALSDPASGDATVALASHPVTPGITTAAAWTAARAAQQLTLYPVTLTDPMNASFSTSVPPATLATWIAFEATADGSYVPTVATATARAALGGLASKVTRLPVDAKYLTGNGKVVGVLAAKSGSQLDVDGSLAAISAALSSYGGGPPGPSVALVVTSVAPKLSTDEAKQTAPLMTLVGSWTTHYVPSEANYWGKNISIPTSILDGYVVAPGAWFSFWDAIGEVTAAKGYGPGGAIINGHTEETGALAGGICSCSTTLFNAALRAGYQIGERANHYYYISRYPVGLDATVAKGTGWEQNMTWRNDTAYPVLIHGINAYGVVTFQLFSVDPHRTVTLSTPIVKNYRYASDSTQYVTTLKPGQAVRVEYPSNGFDAWVTWTVKDAAGTVIHQETFYSHYATVNGLVQVGVASLPSPSPSPPGAASGTASPSPSP